MQGSNHDKSSPHDLSTRIADGDADALAEVDRIFQDHVRPTIEHAFGRWLDDSEIDDVASETLFKFWRGRTLFDATKPIIPWLTVIARHAACDVLRSRRRPSKSSVDDLADTRSATLVDHRSDWALQNDLGEPMLPHVREFVARLRPIDRDILRAILNFGNAEHWTEYLARSYRVSPGVLRVRKHRLVRRLKEILARHKDPT